MSRKALRFVNTYRKNTFPRIHRALTQGASNPDKIIMRYVATVALIAKRSMKKAPKRPKSRFGQLKGYTKRSQKYGRYYWQKGMYSRPGHPPFWVDKGNANGRRGLATLKSITFERIGPNHYRVGPTYFAQKAHPPVPALHEHGGTLKVKYNSYLDRLGKRIRRPVAKTARYPKRPYMAPAMIIAKRYGGIRSFITQINTMAGLRANRKAS